LLAVDMVVVIAAAVAVEEAFYSVILQFLL
jgi:hypothetical protein